MKSLAITLHFITVCILLIFGNSLRFLPIQGSFGSVNFGELMVFATAIFVLNSFGRGLWKFHSLWVLLALTTYSLVIGVIKNGLDTVGIAYNLRLSLLIASFTALGIGLFHRLTIRNLNLLSIILQIYLITGILAIVLLIFFPNAELLWKTLSDSGIDFAGDPHTGRLVSLYFDPNFYGIIISLPLCLAFFAYIRFKKIIYMLYAIFFGSILIFTLSRSAVLVSFFTILAGIIRPILNFILSPTVSLRLLAYLFLGIMCVIPVVLQFSDLFINVYERIANVATDDSAAARLDSASTANLLIQNEPIFGYGYHFSISSIERLRDGFIIDSSIQLLIMDFGIFGFIILFLSILLFFVNLQRRVKSCRQSGLNEEDRLILRIATPYFWVCFLVASNFNNLVFYPFWLIPIGSIFIFYSLKCRQ